MSIMIVSSCGIFISDSYFLQLKLQNSSFLRLVYEWMRALNWLFISSLLKISSSSIESHKFRHYTCIFRFDQHFVFKDLMNRSSIHCLNFIKAGLAMGKFPEAPLNRSPC